MSDTTKQPLSFPVLPNTQNIYSITPTPRYVAARGQLAASNATLFTAPSLLSAVAGEVTRFVHIILNNTDTATRTVTLYVVESGGTAADNRAILKDATWAAKTMIAVAFNIPLAAGDTIQGFSDAASKMTYVIVNEG